MPEDVHFRLLVQFNKPLGVFLESFRWRSGTPSPSGEAPLAVQRTRRLTDRSAQMPLQGLQETLAASDTADSGGPALGRPLLASFLASANASWSTP